MVSLQSSNNSYLEETESCYPKPYQLIYKSYTKGSIMDVITTYSPLFSYLVQFSKLDYMLDSMEFKGTCIVPCIEYSNTYMDYISKNINILRAREIVLSSLLRAPMLYSNLQNEESIPTLNRYYDLELVHYSDQVFIRNQKIPGNYIQFIKTDLQCKNGVLHLINGLIDPSLN